MKFTIENNVILEELIRIYPAFVFDLDNTLYQETDFLFFVYDEIHNHLSKKYGSNDYANFMKTTFVSEGRMKLLDKVVVQYSLPDSEKEKLLSLFRTTVAQPPLQLYSGVAELFTLLVEQGKKIFILTNGHPEQQENKVRSIEWGNVLDKISVYYANRYERKPSPKGLLAIIADHGLHRDELVFIGDHETDRLCALAAGVRYVSLETFLTSTK